MGFQLNEDSLTPLYQQLMEDIKTSLAEGSICRMKRYLLSRTLSELYHVSRITVRRAIEDFAPRGTLKKTGQGTCQPAEGNA